MAPRSERASCTDDAGHRTDGTPIVGLISLAAWIFMVYYADSHPNWRDQATTPEQPDRASGPGTSRCSVTGLPVHARSPHQPGIKRVQQRAAEHKRFRRQTAAISPPDPRVCG